MRPDPVALLATATVVVALSLPGRAAEPPTSPPAAGCAVEPLTWLAGAWAAPQDDGRVEEHWTPPGGGTLFGINRTIAGPRTTAWELLRIECREGRLTYLASPGGRQPPAPFALDAEASDLERFLVFVNPEHDYPQRIEYALEAEDRLVARISGGLGTAVLSWTFERTAGGP